MGTNNEKEKQRKINKCTGTRQQNDKTQNDKHKTNTKQKEKRKTIEYTGKQQQSENKTKQLHKVTNTKQT